MDYVVIKCPRLYTDYDTDAIIQASLRSEVAKDVTLLTVAHRLQTIMDYDKIVRTRNPIFDHVTPI